MRRAVSWAFVGNIVYAGAQWGMLAVLAKLGAPEIVGQFALGLAVTAPLALFANLQLRGLQATDARSEFDFSDYLGLRLVTTAMFIVITFIIVSVAGYDAETSLVVCAIGIAKAFEAGSDIFHGLFQKHERMDWVARSLMLKGPFSLFALAVAVRLSGSAVWGALAMGCAWAAVLIQYDLPKARNLAQSREAMVGEMSLPPLSGRIVPRFDLGKMTGLARLALPLGAVMMIISLNTNIPRYFIEREFGVRELGIFAALAYLIIAGRTVVAALGQAASPRLARYYASGNRAAFQRLVLRLSGVALLVGIGGIAVAWSAGGYLLTLVYTPEYAAYHELFIWIMVAGVVGYLVSIQGYTMTAARYLRAQLPVAGLVLITTTVASLILVPRYGLLGGAWALITASTVQLILGAVVNFHALMKLPAPQREINRKGRVPK